MWSVLISVQHACKTLWKGIICYPGFSITCLQYLRFISQKEWRSLPNYVNSFHCLPFVINPHIFSPYHCQIIYLFVKIHIPFQLCFQITSLAWIVILYCVEYKLKLITYSRFPISPCKLVQFCWLFVPFVFSINIIFHIKRI